MLSGLMGSEENKYKLTDQEVIDQVITILYSGFETVSTTSMMAVKYLHDNPKVLQELRVKNLFTFFHKFDVAGFSCCSVLTFLLKFLGRTFSN